MEYLKYICSVLAALKVKLLSVMEGAILLDFLKGPHMMNLNTKELNTLYANVVYIH